MSDGIDLLDLSELQPELDGFRSADVILEADSVLQSARQLMARLQLAAETDESTKDWQAVRVTQATGAHTITCWNEAAGITLIGDWNGGALESLIVQVGDRYWASRATNHGESRISHDPNVEGPADRRPFADLEKRSRDEMERWKKEHPRVERWVCANCSWQNERDHPTCRVCGIAKSAPAEAIHPETRATIVESFPEPDEAPHNNVMNLPPGMDEILRALIAVAPKPPAEAQFEIALLGFAPESRGAIVEAVRDALHATEEDAEKLIATLPAVIRRGLSVKKARSLSERLQALGASIEIRKELA